jgi:hypothetical protein
VLPEDAAVVPAVFRNPVQGESATIELRMGRFIVTVGM